MEYEKKIKVLSGIIVLLLALYIVGTIFSSGNINRRRVSQPIIGNAFANRISAIRVDMLEGDIFFHKEDGSWFYTHNGKKYPAAESRIENFIDIISKLKKNQIAASNSRSWDRFDILDGETKDAIFYDSSNNELFRLHVGKRGPVRGGGEYIRTSLSEEVYLLDAPILRFFQGDFNFWSNLRVLPEGIDNTTITAVRVRTDNSFGGGLGMLNFLMREEHISNDFEWRDSASGKAINRNSANMLLNNIAALTGDSFSEEHIIDRNAEIEIETVYGRFIIDIKLFEGPEDRSYLFGIRGSDYRYTSSSFRIERILGSVKEINEELN